VLRGLYLPAISLLQLCCSVLWSLLGVGKFNRTDSSKQTRTLIYAVYIPLVYIVYIAVAYIVYIALVAGICEVGLVLAHIHAPYTPLTRLLHASYLHTSYSACRHYLRGSAGTRLVYLLY
jgi:hypothetical protein